MFMLVFEKENGLFSYRRGGDDKEKAGAGIHDRHLRSGRHKGGRLDAAHRREGPGDAGDPPNGETARFPIEEIKIEEEAVSCGVKKDSGDDPDITNGILVESRVERIRESAYLVEGGTGVGRVTKPGLNQPVGASAINRVPREMIRQELSDAAQETGYEGGLKAVISIPEGEKLAERTFNPRLGIEGGLSILGTSGRVEPMSEQALLDTIRLEMQVKYAEGKRYLILSPGNYGLDFLKQSYGIEETDVVKCSNFIGDSIDMAAETGYQGLVLVGHIGKLIKVAGGIMNTHSKWRTAGWNFLRPRRSLPGFRKERQSFPGLRDHG